jgi:ERF superfamily
MQSDSVVKINEAILLAQAEMKPVKKDKNNPFFNSKYADLPSVWASIEPFRKHGLTIVQMPMLSEPSTIAIETRMTHVSGEWYSSVLVLPLAKNDPQSVGSAITYGRRYALGCMTGQVTEDDDDGNAASQSPSKTPYATTARASNAKKVQAMQAPKKPTPATVIDDVKWQEFLDYAGDDPDRMGVIAQLKEVLAIGMVSDLQGEARRSFIVEFQESCKNLGVPCEEWVKYDMP